MAVPVLPVLPVHMTRRALLWLAAALMLLFALFWWVLLQFEPGSNTGQSGARDGQSTGLPPWVVGSASQSGGNPAPLPGSPSQTQMQHQISVASTATACETSTAAAAPLAGKVGAAETEAQAQARAEDRGLARVAASQANRQRAAALLLARDDARSQAAGLFFQADGGMNPVLPECQTSHCDAALLRQRQQAMDGPVARLARLANAGRSGEVYGWALLACGTGAMHGLKSTHCDALNHARWAELSPGSVWPWAALAGQARRLNDGSGVENAMARAATASDWRSATAGLPALLCDALPPEVSVQGRLDLLGQAMGTNTMGMQYQGLINHCPAEQDANRRQVCHRLATQLLDKADNLLALAIGLSVGERLGLPAERLAAARQQRDAAFSAAAQRSAPLLAADSSGRCEAMVNLLQCAVGVQRW